MRYPIVLAPLAGRTPDFGRIRSIVALGSGTRAEVARMAASLARTFPGAEIHLLAQPECRGLPGVVWHDTRAAAAAPLAARRRLARTRPDLVAFVVNGRPAFWRQWLFAAAFVARGVLVYNEHGDGFFLGPRNLGHLYRTLFRRGCGARGSRLVRWAEFATKALALPWILARGLWLHLGRPRVSVAFALPLPGQWDWSGPFPPLPKTASAEVSETPDGGGRRSTPTPTAGGTMVRPTETPGGAPAFTGERFHPGVDPDLEVEHLSRYAFAAQFAAGRRVLDAGCGEGYGTALLARSAAEAVGVDVSEEIVAHARLTYPLANLRFEHVAPGRPYPFEPGSFDLVTSFEVIEHIEDWRGYLERIARVLADDGLLVLSSPNRPYYRDERGEVNEFHIKEFDLHELDEILAVHFAHRRIFGQNHFTGVLIEDYDGEEVRVGAPAPPTGRELETSHYLIALCSRRPLPPARGLVFPCVRGNQMREREREIAFLRRELARAKAAYERLEREFEERSLWAVSLQRENEALKARRGG